MSYCPILDKNGVLFNCIVMGANFTDYLNTLKHELGHGIGGLSDEYAMMNKPYENTNLTQNTDTAKVKWSQYINKGTNIYLVPDGPTYTATGGNGTTVVGKWYSPSETCIMRNHVSGEYDPVCLNAMKTALNTITGVTLTADWVGDPMVGDVNYDGYVNAEDYTALKTIVDNKTTLTGIALYNADMNADGYADITDLNLLELYLNSKNIPLTKPTGVVITSNLGSMTLPMGSVGALSAIVLPELALQAVTWRSNNPSVATVSSSGIVTGKYTGNTTITATATADANISASYPVTVTPAAPNAKFNLVPCKA